MKYLLRVDQEYRTSPLKLGLHLRLFFYLALFTALCFYNLRFSVPDSNAAPIVDTAPINDEVFVDGSLPHSCSGMSYSIANRNCAGHDGIGVKTFAEAVQYDFKHLRINVREGVYKENVVISRTGPLSLSSDSSLVIRGYKKENAILDGQGMGPVGILILGGSNIEFSNLTIRKFDRVYP